MYTPLDIVLGDLEVLVLVVCRVAGFMVNAPVFGGSAIPRLMKVYIALALGLALVPVVPVGDLGPRNLGNAGLDWLLYTAASELGLGLVTGFAAGLLFSAAQLAGHYTGQQIGFAIANVIDPISNTSVSILGQFLFIMSLLVFLAVDAHLMMFGAFARTLASVPLGTAAFHEETALLIVHGPDNLTQQMWELSVTMAAPAIVTLLIMTIVLGFLAKVAPEANVFVVGFTVRIIGGLVLLILLLPYLADMLAILVPEVASTVTAVANTLKSS